MPAKKPEPICYCDGAPVPIIDKSGTYVTAYVCFKCGGLKIGGLIYDTTNKP